MKFNFNKKRDNLPPIEYRNIQPKEKTTLEKIGNVVGNASVLYCLGYTAIAQINELRSGYYNNKVEVLPPDVGIVERLKIVDPKNIRELRSAKIELSYDEGVTVPNQCSINIIKSKIKILSNQEFVLTAAHCFSGTNELKPTLDTGSISEKFTQYTQNGEPVSDYALIMPRKVFEKTYPNLRIVDIEKSELELKVSDLSIHDSLSTLSCENNLVVPQFIDIGATKIIETADIKRIFVPGNSGSLIYQYLKSDSKNSQNGKLCLAGMAIRFKLNNKQTKSFVESVTMFSPDPDPKKPWKQKTIQTKKAS